MLKMKSIVYLLLVFLFSTVTLYGFGYGVKIAHVVALGLMLLCFQYRLLYGITIIVLAVVSGLYYPITMLYGQLNENIVLSFLYTDKTETVGYLKAISTKTLLVSLLPLCVGVLCLAFRLMWTRNVILPRVMLLIPLVVITGSAVKQVIKTGEFDMAVVHFPPVRFAIDAHRITKKILIEDEFYQTQKNKPTDYRPTIVGSPVDTVVVVIGESARRDRMSLYDFELPNTPYMDKMPGTVFTNYISAGPSTAISLAHSLFKLNPKSEKFRVGLSTTSYAEANYDDSGRVEYNNSIVKLANAAGYKTYWISNQEPHSEYAEPEAVAANQSDYVFFASYGGIGDKEKEKPFDSVLTPEVLDAMSKPEPKVIFVHIYGSHSAPCDRIKDRKYEVFYHSGETSCYVQTIKNTDEQLHTFLTKLKETNKSWALMYFSDHGLLTINPDTPDEYYIHGDKYKSNYDVPLFIATSEDTKQSRDDRALSGFDLLSLIAKTAHISDPILPEVCQSVKTCPADRKVISNAGEYIHYNDLSSSY